MAIKSTRLSSPGATEVYKSTGSNAITTIIVCNTGTPDPLDEDANKVNLSMYLVPSGTSTSPTLPIQCRFISELNIPAGETIFFSDEKIVLDNNDSLWSYTLDNNLISITVSTLRVD